MLVLLRRRRAQSVRSKHSPKEEEEKARYERKRTKMFVINMNYKFALVGGEILKSARSSFFFFYDVLDYYFLIRLHSGSKNTILKR